MLENNAKDNLDKLFANALRARADKDGVPTHVYEAIMSEMVKVDANAVGDRGVQCPQGGCVVPLSLERIWDYGCWCNMGPNLKEGYSRAVDDYDMACQNMQRCLRCAEMDAVDGGYECNARTTPFTASFGFGAQNLMADCESTNQDDPCAVTLCTCETQFISEIMDHLWEGKIYTSDYKHD